MISNFEPFRKKLTEKVKLDKLFGNKPAHLSLQYDQWGRLHIHLDEEQELRLKSLPQYTDSVQ